MGSRLRAALPLLAALGTFAPGAASAQTLGIVIENIDGRKEDEFQARELTNIPINAVECEEGRGIDLEVNNIPTSASLLDFWSSTGPNCNETEPRSDSTVEGCTWLLDRSTNGQRTLGDSSAGTGDPLKIPAVDFIPRDEQPCAEVDETLVIFVLAANSSMSTADVSSNWGSIDIAFDTRPPAMPAGVEGIAGESRVGAKWDLSDSDLLEHRLYVDTSGGACGGGGTDAGGTDAAMDAALADGGGDAGDAAMSDAATDAGTDAGPLSMDAGPTPVDAGMADGGLTFPDGGFSREMVPSSCEPIPGGQTVGEQFELVRCVEGTSESAALGQSRLDGLGIGLGDTVAIAITAVDQARNESEPAVACVTRVDTTGFCESFGGEGCPDGCGCTAPGGAGPASTGMGLAFGALLVACTGLWLARRRRRRG